MTNISLPYITPRILPLTERIPDLREKYAYFDPILYKYVSDIPASLLPVPIDRDEAEYWRKQRHEVMRLPTLVINNPLIKFSTSGEIWLRTPQQGRFTLVEKKGGYIPLMHNIQSSNGILVSVNPDMTLTDTLNRSEGGTYILKEYKSLSDKIGRLAYISKAALELLTPIFPQNALLSNVYRLGISMNILHALNNALSMSVTANQVSEYAYLCMQENWEQSISDVTEDIRSQRILPLRHFRALEQVYHVNIYFLMDDQLEPYLRKPPHAYFYLHRRAQREWPTLIFHSLSTDPNTYSLITLTTTGGARGYKHLFSGQEYLDNLMDKNNVIRMVSPLDGVDERLQTIPIEMDISGWKAIEQVVDTYGKCRAITYQKKVEDILSIATLNIGFASIQDLPIREIRSPSLDKSGIPVMISDIGDETLSKLILRPSSVSTLSQWAETERNTRILRIVTHLLYSQMDLSIDEFIDYLTVDENVSYDTNSLMNVLPNIQGSYEQAWEYFASVLPGMVIVDDDSYEIVVPDEKTKRALKYHILATPKMQWPMKFPSYVKYTWDIQCGREEMVFLRDIDLIQYMIMSRAPTETTTIVISPIPYILSRGDHKYLIQMAANNMHAQYIAYMWDNDENDPINIGYEGIVEDIEYPWREVSHDFSDRIYEISFTLKDSRIFVIIPL